MVVLAACDRNEDTEALALYPTDQVDQHSPLQRAVTYVVLASRSRAAGGMRRCRRYPTVLYTDTSG